MAVTDERHFVGREQEMADLEAALHHALDGRGSLVAISGEPGIGKTTLARTLAARAELRGATIAWGSCWEAGGAPAYWPWIGALRALARRADASGTTSATALRRLAALDGELHERLAPDEPQLEPLDPDQGRFQLFDALTGYLRATAERTPLVVVLDDLHWADGGSLQALEFLTGALADARLLVLATYRDTELAAADADLGIAPWIGRAGGRVVLRGLEREAVAELVRRRLGQAPEPDVVDTIHDVSGGNPLFATELARGLRDPAGGAVRLPDGVRQAIARRLTSLSAPTVETLRAASVVGREFRVATLSHVTGAPFDELLERLDEGTRSGVLEERRGESGTYAFSHALVRDALRDGLEAAERARLHLLAGEALEHLYGADVTDRFGELAYHFLEAAPLAGGRRGLEYTIRAAERAAATAAHEEAARLYERALQAAETAGEPDARRWQLLHARGEALTRAGELELARTTLLRAADVARALDDATGFASSVMSLRVWALLPGVVDEEFVRLLEEAERRLTEREPAPGESGLLALVKARLAMALYWSDTAGRRRQLAEEAVALARALPERTDADETLAWVLDITFVATWGPDNVAEGLARSKEVLELCRRVGERELETQARSWRIALLLEVDDLGAADQEIEAFSRLAEELRQPRALVYDPLHRALRAILDGRFAEAEALQARAGELLSQLPGSIGGLIVAAQQLWMRRSQGRMAEMEPLVGQAADHLPAMPAWRAARCLLALEDGREAEGRSEFESLAADRFAAVPRDNLWLVTCALLAESAELLSDRAAAACLRELLEPHARRNVVSPEAAYLGPVTRWLGLLAAAEGDLSSASAWLADARERAAGLGARPTLVQILVDEARVMARGDGEEAQLRARVLLDEAQALAEAMGLDVVTARIGRVREALGPELAPAARAASPTPSVVGAASLRREGEVWSLSFDGATLRLRDAKGLQYLALLLATPGVERHAADLVAGFGGEAPAVAVARAALATGELVAAAPGGGDAGPMLDESAKTAYRERVTELRSEIEEAESFNDPERAERAREELEFVARELSAAVGLGGRDRRTGSDAERARVNVTRAIRSSLKRIAEQHPDLGRLLETTVRTGTFCVYEPDPRIELHWEVVT